MRRAVRRNQGFILTIQNNCFWCSSDLSAMNITLRCLPNPLLGYGAVVWITAVSMSEAATPGGTLAQPQHVELNPVVVTGTRTAQRLNETPIRTEVLGHNELQLARPRWLADAIELLPGARVENNCQNCGTSEILLLGLEQKYTQLLFDGAPLFSGVAGVYGIEQIPSTFIDRIEVVKGGGSAVYGGGAVGGVINLIGRRPERTGGLVEVRFDDVKGRAATTASGILDHVSGGGGRVISLHGQHARGEAVDLNDDGISDLTQRRLDVIGLRWIERVGDGELRADYSRTEEFRRGGNKFELPDNLADISERVDTARDAASLAWRGSEKRDLQLSAAAGFARIDRQTFYGGLFGRGVDELLTPESAPGIGDNDQPLLDRGYRTAGEVARDQFGYTENWVWNLEAQVDRRWGQHLTSIGAQYFREKVDDFVPVGAGIAEYPVEHDVASGHNVGLFVQDDWRIAPRWQVVLGLRADRNSELGRAVASPRVNVKWQASDELTLRGTLGTGFRAPQPFDEDLHIELIAGNRTRTVQAPDLREEKSRSALLSADYQPHFAQGRLAIEATVFLTQIRGAFANSEVRVDPVTGDGFRARYNGPDAEVGGLELNVGALPFSRLRVDLGLIAQRARFKQPVTLFDDGTGESIRERDFLETPRRYGVLQFTYLDARLADLSLSATYTGHMKEINQRTGVLNARTQDFLVWNAALSRRFGLGGLAGVTVVLGAKNLFDARQADLETGVDRDPYYLYGPRTPRTWFVSAKLDF
jgi:outer membrane receptor for ferrienterochelin and colicins